MTKEEKLVVINAIAEQLQAYPHFYIADIEALNAEQTAALRRKCYESDIKLVVVKNTLLAKALEKVEKADAVGNFLCQRISLLNEGLLNHNLLRRNVHAHVYLSSVTENSSSEHLLAKINSDLRLIS